MSATEPDPENYIGKFEALLASPDPRAPRSKLWFAWHYLQVYSYWGVRLPHTQAALALQLGTKEPRSYGFFTLALEAYGSVHAACDTFLLKVFPAIVDLGTKLRQFAVDVTGKDGELAAAIEMIDQNDVEAALELLSNLQKTATENADEAKAVAIALGEFQSSLITAYGKLNSADQMVEKDAKTSQATIDRLTSQEPDPEKAKDSLAGIKKFIKECTERYDQYVTIAATSPTYAWIFPVGLIAAAAVAGTYGARAREQLELVRQYQADLEKMQAELRTALAAHDVQRLAHTQLSGARSHTKAAIDYTTDIQNAWKDVAGDVGTLLTSIKGMTKLKENEVVPAAQRVMQIYARKAAQAWGRILPPLNDLTDKPYITISEGIATFATLLADKALRT